MMINRKLKLSIKKYKPVIRSSKRSESKKSSYERILFMLFAALLSFLGAVGGTLFSSRIEDEAWKRNSIYNYQLAILNKRIELSERTVKMTTHLMRARYLGEAREYLLSLPLESLTSENMDDVAKMQDEMDEIKEEYATVAKLDILYFGPETKEAFRKVQESTENIYEIDDDLINEISQAITDELLLGLDFYKLH